MSSPNFNPLQSAYRRFHSTETALLHTTDCVLRAADNGQPTILVSLDLSAAFDMVEHQLLLNRLNNSFGISGSALNWVTSYLNGRHQFVFAGSARSTTSELSVGVPQGSVLGPLLFTLYTSPIGYIANSWNVCHQQYADDTQFFISLSSDNPQGIGQLQDCLSDLHAWFCLNSLALNNSKSEAIFFCSSQLRRHIAGIQSVDVAGTNVTVSDTIKTLGVILDNKLSFDNQIKALCKSCYFHIKALRHIRPVLTVDSAKSIACSLVGSRLDYANSLFYGITITNINKLQRVQNNLAKLVTGCYSVRSSELLYNLHWLPIKQRIDFKLATLTYKLLLHKQPSYLFNSISPYYPARALRSSDQHLLVRPRVSTVTGTRAFSVAAPAVWNAIPLAIRQHDTLTGFKRQLKAYLFPKP